MSEWIEVGYIQKAHGIKGEVFLRLFDSEASWLKKTKSLKIVLKNQSASSPGILVTIAKCSTHKGGLIGSFNELNDRNTAEAWVGAKVFVAAGVLVSEPGEPIFLNEILGFKMVDSSSGTEGLIQGFSSNGAQDLLVVKTSNGVYEVPFVKDFVVKINWDLKTVELRLPLGLLGELD